MGSGLARHEAEPPEDSGAEGADPHRRPEIAPSPRADRGWRDPAVVTIAALAFATIAVEVLGLAVRDGRLWGADAYAFLPRAMLAWTIAAVLGLVALLGRAPASHATSAVRPRRPGLAAAVALAGAAALFWTFRIRHVLLGDGIPITSQLPDHHDLHPREPLASLIQQLLYPTLSPMFAHDGVPRAQVVQNCVAVGSVVAGVAFVAVAWGIGRELERTFPARAEGTRSVPAWMLAVALLSQGYVQMFFGYVENYSYSMVVAGCFVLASLRFLRGAAPLWIPLAALALGIGLHFSAVVLIPAALTLVVSGLIDRDRRPAVARDLALVTILAAVVVMALALGPWHFSIAGTLSAMVASGRAGAGYLLSAAHLRDFLNEHLLLGPFGLLLFAPLALILALKIRAWRPAHAFLLVIGATVAAACWLAPDLPMGYARDWDLYAPMGVALTIAALGVTLALVEGARARRTALIVVIGASLIHTIPWIALNTSEARSVERFATLPLGLGRTENTLAFWHAQRGDYAEAKRWLKRSLDANPTNTRAMDLMGRIALTEGKPERAIQAYLVALTLRPDKEDYRRQLAVALDAAGGAPAGLAQLDLLMAGREDDAMLWLERAMLLDAAGRVEEARAARARGLRLRPDLAALEPRLPR